MSTSTVGSSSSSGTAAGAGPQTPTASLSAGSDTVSFAFNPATLKFMTTARTTPKPREGHSGDSSTSGGSGNPAFTGNMADILAFGDVTLTVDAVYLLGDNTKEQVMQLLRWARGEGSQEGTDLTALKFQWGNTQYDVKLKQVTATVERFTTAGDASRATCSLTMQMLELPPKGTNPSSRGEPGGTHHQVIDGETMCRVAEQRYGHPRYWRQIADANGIDDPLRIRAGRRLYLPSPQSVKREQSARAADR